MVSSKEAELLRSSISHADDASTDSGPHQASPDHIAKAKAETERALGTTSSGNKTSSSSSAGKTGSSGTTATTKESSVSGSFGGNVSQGKGKEGQPPTQVQEAAHKASSKAKDLESKAEDKLDEASQKAKEVASDVSKGLDKAGKELDKAGKKLGKKAREVEGEGREWAKRYPEAAGGVVGLGLFSVSFSFFSFTLASLFLSFWSSSSLVRCFNETCSFLVYRFCNLDSILLLGVPSSFFSRDPLRLRSFTLE